MIGKIMLLVPIIFIIGFIVYKAPIASIIITVLFLYTVIAAYLVYRGD